MALRRQEPPNLLFNQEDVRSSDAFDAFAGAGGNFIDTANHRGGTKR